MRLSAVPAEVWVLCVLAIHNVREFFTEHAPGSWHLYTLHQETPIFSYPLLPLSALRSSQESAADGTSRDQKRRGAATSPRSCAR